MTPTELLSEMDGILDDSKSALLATVDPQGRPRLRWMTPRRIKGRAAYLYSTSDHAARKIDDIRRNPRVSWTIQRAASASSRTVRSICAWTRRAANQFPHGLPGRAAMRCAT